MKTGIADHDGVVCQLNCKDVTEIPQFFISRNYSKVNAMNILPMIDEDKDLQDLFGDTDSEVIASKLNKGLNKITVSLIEKKKIQNKKDVKSFDDSELKATRHAIKRQSKIANESGDADKNRLLRNIKNVYTKLEKKKKPDFEEKALKNIRYKWKFIRNEDEEKIPVKVVIDRSSTSNQRKIANKYMEHIQNKIDSLTAEKPDRKDDAMKIFLKLIEKVEENFEFHEVLYKDIYKTITKLKPSRARGDNKLTNKILKEIPQYSTLAIMHLFNWMVRTSKFPSEFKVSRILPLKKKDKPSSALESFRPMNNMNPIEKILE